MLRPVAATAAFEQALQSANYFARRRGLHWKPKPPWPRFLYKFRALRTPDPAPRGGPAFTADSIEELRTVLVDSLLWLSGPVKFIDPFDMWDAWTLKGSAKERLRRFRELAKKQRPELNFKQREQAVRNLMVAPEEQTLAFLNCSFSQQRLNVGVCCFAAGNPRDVLMWSHYAAAHAGVCLQFEITRDPRVLMRAVAVAYDDNYPVINWIINPHRALGETLTRKHSRWSHEKERRIISDSKANCFIRFNPSALTAIVFGCRARQDVKDAVTRLLEERESRGLPKLRRYYRAPKQEPI